MLKTKINKWVAMILVTIMTIAFYMYMPQIKANAYQSAYPIPNLTGNQREDIVNIALSQKGYKKDNGTVYGAWYDSIKGTNYTNSAWCAMFVSWCANKAGIDQNVLTYRSYVPDMVKDFQDKKQWHDRNYTPSRGDIIIVNSSGHVGIVTGVSGNTVYTIEGNKTSLGSACGTDSYKIGSSYITGYGVPNYSSPSTSKKWYDDYSPVDLGDNFYAYIKNNSVDNGTLSNIESKNVQGCEQVATKNQIWSFRKQNDGSYAILSFQDGLSMDVASYGVENGTNIQMTTFSGNTAQKFYVYNINGFYFFRPMCSDLVFDMDLNSYNLETWVFDSTYSSKQFEIDKIDCNGNLPVDIGSGFYAYIENKGINMLISNVNSSNVQGCEPINAANQIWKFIRQNDGSYAVLSYQDGLSMDISNYGTENGTNIQMRVYSGNIAQRFFIYNINNSYFFKPICSDLVFDMDSTSYNLETWVFDSTYPSKQFAIKK